MTPYLKVPKRKISTEMVIEKNAVEKLETTHDLQT